METEDVILLPEGSDRGEGNKLSRKVSDGRDDGDGPAGGSLRPSLEKADAEEGQFVSTTEVVEEADVSVSLRQSLDKADVEEGQFVSMTEVVKEADVSKADDTQILGDIAAPFENGCLNDVDVEEGQLLDMDIEENDVASLSIWHNNTGNDVGVGETNVKADILPSKNGFLSEPSGTKVTSTSGVKRTRTMFNEQHPSVQVKYIGLSRESKHKLEELLREWSEWHARNSSQREDGYGVSESGEETYFPALNVGTGKNAAVSFWMENKIRKPDDVDFTPVGDASIPLYDRGFSLGSNVAADGSSNLEGDLQFLDAPRCFNCSSYNHSLRECPKPRDNDAVNNSRKQHMLKRNQTPGMRNPTRYYQDTPTGKYEGLKPGSLDAETRRLLGLGESDPPPWLNRMREIGYPPGYLEPEDENLPSGITIFADKEIKEQEAGEILEPELGDVGKKMSVKYPGVNAPIPENADENAWATRPSNPDRYRNGDGGRSHRSSESNFRGRFREQNNQDDDPFGFDRPSRYASRYGDHDFNSTSRSWRDDDSRPRSPNYGRSTRERARNDPLDPEDALAYRLYSSFSYGSDRHNDGVDISRVDRDDYTPRSWERDDRYQRYRER